MLYLFINQLGWWAFTALLIVVVVLYTRINQQIRQLRRDITLLQSKIETYKEDVITTRFAPTTDSNPSEVSHSELETPLPSTTLSSNQPPQLQPLSSKGTEANSNATANPFIDRLKFLRSKSQLLTSTSTIEPDEHSLPIVTSLIHSLKNWFFGGNLVVRVGVLVLLVGVVLLLRLLSDYIEIPIAFKLTAIGVLGLGLAALGLKLVKNRFAYGITLQGAGLAIAYLTTFFAYSVYQVLASVPSFIGLGLLSALTVVLAVRQNAFPLALLALSGGFFAPILTSQDTDSLTVLFSYYLLLNVTIAAIAHYRPWKVLNIFGAGVTFGLAYYWGLTENLTVIIDDQRWSLVILVTLHLILYLFVVIRYAQQIIAYNDNNEAIMNVTNVEEQRFNYVFPIDIGLLFSVPILAFGLFSALLHDIHHALTIVSAVLAMIYLGLGWRFIKRSQRYALITEGMLTLGFGFLALVIPLALNAEWIAFGWSVQGLALVWFGRRSLRAWSVLFGVLLQLISITMLLNNSVFNIEHYPTLALTISAVSAIISAFILRASNSPDLETNALATSASDTENHTLSTYAKVLGISEGAVQQWLSSIDNQSMAFKLIWQRPALIRLLTFAAMVWQLYVLLIDFDQWFTSWRLATTALIGLAALTSLIIYYAINQYRPWREIRQFSHGLLLLFYTMLLFQLPQKYEFDYQWTTFHWPIFITFVIGWLVVGQYWIKTWHNNNNGNFELKGYDSASWLGTGIIILAEAIHYGFPDSDAVITVLVPVTLMLAGLWVTYRYNQRQDFKDNNIETQTISAAIPPYWFDWQRALLDSAKVFVPLTLGWVIFTNFTYDGVIWGLPYFPLFNLYDVTLWLILLYGLGIYLLRQPHFLQQNLLKSIYKSDTLLTFLVLISFWILSSMLVRTLHSLIGTPLWINGAWSSEQVQTGLTILWTLIALVATIIASRYGQRMLWFMGIGLLGIVVIKLVLVDLSQTEAIWRVISFLGAGSLILVIGYLAPLPPARKEIKDGL